MWAEQQAPSFPDEILNPVEVSGEEAVPIIGRLPGARRMYVLPANIGEYHRVGSQVMTRIARPVETGDVHELMTFAGRTGATLPRHAHLSSHAALLVMRGEIELELTDERWRMMRGDFANLPAGTPHGWTMRSDGAQLALFTMNDRVGAAFAAMGTPQANRTCRRAASYRARRNWPVRRSRATFQLAPRGLALPEPQKVTNDVLPLTPGPYVLADGGGERFGGNTFLARNANTSGQFLFIITEGGPGGGVGAHFHARHFENFFALDGETLGWAYGKAVPLQTGDYFQAPPRNLHGFRLTQAYNRFAAFLTPGIFESFFTRGGPGRGGGGARAGAGEPGAAGGGTWRGRGRRRRAWGLCAGGPDMFRALQMSGRGPDGYPLDVHPPSCRCRRRIRCGPKARVATRSPIAPRCLAHAQAICGVPISREITPELRRALALKPIRPRTSSDWELSA